MITRTNAQLLKVALLKERSILDATAGRILRAAATYGDNDRTVVEYITAAASAAATSSTNTEKLIEVLDTFLGR